MRNLGVEKRGTGCLKAAQMKFLRSILAIAIPDHHAIQTSEFTISVINPRMMRYACDVACRRRRNEKCTQNLLENLKETHSGDLGVDERII